MNLYAYVGNDPVNATDPSGLDRVEVTTHNDQLLGIEAFDDGSDDTTVSYSHSYTVRYGDENMVPTTSVESSEFETIYTNVGVGNRGVQEAIASQISELTGRDFEVSRRSSQVSRFLEAMFGLGPPRGVGTRFANQRLLDNHFRKHGHEFGARSASDYERMARGFLGGAPGRGVMQGVRRNGDIVRFNARTNEFGVIRPDGTIRTYFRPNPRIHGRPTNRDYFLDELSR